MTAAGTERSVVRFAGAFAYLSNFHPAPFTLHMLPWRTAEHAFQGFKAASFHDRCRIADLPTAREAKAAGRAVGLRADWEQVKKRVMFDVLMAKFTQNPDLRGALCGTNRMHLAEGNTWHDNYWGDCSCGRAACEAAGSNYLGKCLMGVRMILKED